MYKKVLISEDIDTINLAIQLTLFQLAITDIQHVKYCDDALLRVKKAIRDKNTCFIHYFAANSIKMP